MRDREERISDEIRMKEEAYNKLRADPPRLVKKGDRVLVRADMVNRGFAWLRLEGVVVESAYASVCVEFTSDRYGEGKSREWIDTALVLEVLAER